MPGCLLGDFNRPHHHVNFLAPANSKPSPSTARSPAGRRSNYRRACVPGPVRRRKTQRPTSGNGSSESMPSCAVKCRSALSGASRCGENATPPNSDHYLPSECYRCARNLNRTLGKDVVCTEYRWSRNRLSASPKKVIAVRWNQRNEVWSLRLGPKCADPREAVRVRNIIANTPDKLRVAMELVTLGAWPTAISKV